MTIWSRFETKGGTSIIKVLKHGATNLLLLEIVTPFCSECIVRKLQEAELGEGVEYGAKRTR